MLGFIRRCGRRFRSTILWAVLAAGSVALSCTAQAVTTTTTFAVQMTITASCTIVSASTLNFGSQGVLTDTLRDQSQLAGKRYEGGVSSYLEVLDTERQRLTAEQQLAQAQRDVLTTLVQLYKALGGGWQ